MEKNIEFVGIFTKLMKIYQSDDKVEGGSFPAAEFAFQSILELNDVRLDVIDKNRPENSSIIVNDSKKIALYTKIVYHKSKFFLIFRSSITFFHFYFINLFFIL